jgi:surface protein
VFNQPIGNWDVSGVTDMYATFADSKAFNQDLSNWNVSNVRNMNGTFNRAVFNQSLGNWTLSRVNNAGDMLATNALSMENINNTLYGWSTKSPLAANVFMNFAGYYSDPS